MKHWLEVVRWKNLLLIAITQLLIALTLIAPLNILSPKEFTVLLLGVMLSTLLIAASGYIINDYFDVKIDMINRPNKALVVRSIHRRHAVLVHWVLNIIGVFIGAGIALYFSTYSAIFITLISVILLFFYSSHLKRTLFWGNVLVAFLTALSLLEFLLYCPSFGSFLKGDPLIQIDKHTIANPAWVLLIYGAFAFLMTWIREIVKDMEDHIGDAAEQCRTLPIVWGLKSSSVFVVLLAACALLLLLFGCYELQGILKWYVLFFLAVPLFIWLIYFPRKFTTAHFATMSKLLKWQMLFGVLSLLIYYLQSYE